MRVGVPAHRLPPAVVQREIDAIISPDGDTPSRIDLKLNHRVDDIEALLDEYEAVFVAIGAHAGVKLPIPGNDLPGVMLGTEFLRQVGMANNANEDRVGAELENARSMIKGRRVLVLGGGNVAIDTAMTAVRLGASWVGMTCLEGREQMPAHVWEVREAEEEGIEVFPARTFKEVTSQDGQVTGVRVVGIDFHGFVEGRPNFDEHPETEEVLSADVVIFSIGQRPEVSCLKKVQKLPGNRVAVNSWHTRHRCTWHLRRRRRSLWNVVYCHCYRGRSPGGKIDLGLPERWN